MSIESELREQRDFLAKPTTRWARRTLEFYDEACMGYRLQKDYVTGGLGNESIGFAARKWLNNWMVQQGILEAIHGEYNFINWNDHVAQSKYEVIEVLEKAIAAAGEAGV